MYGKSVTKLSPDSLEDHEVYFKFFSCILCVKVYIILSGVQLQVTSQ